MNPYTSDLSALEQDFTNRNIAFTRPGFCDDPPFRAAERTDPHYLDRYAAYVAKRPYDGDYLARAKETIARAASLLHEELVAHGRRGACVDISGILLRMLEEEDVWSCCIKGSLTISFPPQYGSPPRHYYSVDHGNDEAVAGHMWLYAPPYRVVDITVKQQPYDASDLVYIPEVVLAESGEPGYADPMEVLSPSVRAALSRRGVPPNHQLEYIARHVPEIFDSFPVFSVEGLRGARLKYTPVATAVPEEKLSGIGNMSFGGLSPLALYQSKFAGKL